MAITHVDTNTATSANGTSVTVTKPSGAAQDDLLLAFFTSNNQACTPPAGWTEIADEIIEVFRCQVFYKVAGGSEPASYAFSVGAAAPLVCSIACLRGIDDGDPIDIDAVSETDLAHTEAYTTPGLTGGSAGRLVYFRTVRLSGTTPPTFTASGASEISDVGIFSGGTVCYSQGLYLASSDYSGSGSKSGLAITCSAAESHNFVLTMGVKSEAGITGTMGMTVPSVPSVSMAANWAYAATLGATMPMPTMTSSAFSGNFEGPLAMAVPITVSIAGHTDVRGALAMDAGPVVSLTGETRFFGDNSVIPEREERWFVMTQEDYYIGVRSGIDLPMRIEMPLPVVAINASTLPQPPTILIPVVANDPEFAMTLSAGIATSVSVAANNASVLLGDFSAPDELAVPVTANDASVSIVFTAESTTAAVVATAVLGFTVASQFASVSATSYSPTAKIAPTPGSASASVAASSASVNNVKIAPAELVSVSATSNEPTEKVTFSSGHAAVSCHN